MLTNLKYTASTWTLQITFTSTGKEYEYYNVSPPSMKKLQYFIKIKQWGRAKRFLSLFSDKNRYLEKKKEMSSTANS